jgi:hypothetical protein
MSGTWSFGGPVVAIEVAVIADRADKSSWIDSDNEALMEIIKMRGPVDTTAGKSGPVSKSLLKEVLVACLRP